MHIERSTRDIVDKGDSAITALVISEPVVRSRSYGFFTKTIKLIIDPVDEYPRTWTSSPDERYVGLELHAADARCASIRKST